MKTICLLLVFLFLEEAASTHLETCECHEIKSLVNASIEQAIARLENKMISKISLEQALARLENKITFEINSAIDNINNTENITLAENNPIDTKATLYTIESNLTTTMERL